MTSLARRYDAQEGKNCAPCIAKVAQEHIERSYTDLVLKRHQSNQETAILIRTKNK